MRVRLPMLEQRVMVAFKKRCSYCRATLAPGPMELLPKFVGLPQVRCRGCCRPTTLSAGVTVAATVAGCIGAGYALLGCLAIAGSLFGTPLGEAPILLMLAVGLVVWVLGYIVFAMCCYGIHGLWNALRGTD